MRETGPELRDFRGIDPLLIADRARDSGKALRGALRDLFEQRARLSPLENIERFAIVAFARKTPVQFEQITDVIVIDEQRLLEKRRAAAGLRKRAAQLLDLPDRRFVIRDRGLRIVERGLSMCRCAQALPCRRPNGPMQSEGALRAREGIGKMAQLLLRVGSVRQYGRLVAAIVELHERC